MTKYTLLISIAADCDSSPDGINLKVERSNTKIKAIDISFYTLVIACFILGEYYHLRYPDVLLALGNVWIFLDAALKLVSGLLILYSLLKFKGFIKRIRKSNAGHYASERLMAVHFCIFSLFILANFGYCITYTIGVLNTDDWNNKLSNDDASSYCRYVITYDFFIGLMIVTNWMMICLFTYLSVKFSEPIEDYRSSFLLIF